LRVVTLRILAELEYRIGEQAKGPEAIAAANWIKLGEKLRHALGPVREADVWLDELSGLRASLADTNGYSPRANKACMRQIDELEGRLRAKRRQWEKELVAEIDSRRSRLEESAKQIELAPRALVEARNVSQGGALQIREQFAHVVEEFPSLDVDNLHEFRKRIKKVRYLAEIFGEYDAEAAKQASSIRKMQSAIGEWHDWQVLAKRKGHSHGKQEELSELLEALAAESLEKALALCERLTTSLLKTNYGTHDPSQVPPKKPPARSEEFSHMPWLRKSA
jgi:CHAD domain-containing protein